MFKRSKTALIAILFVTSIAALSQSSCSDAVESANITGLRIPSRPTNATYMECTYIGSTLSECHTVNTGDISCGYDPSECPGFYAQVPNGYGETWTWACDASGCPTAPPVVTPNGGGNPTAPGGVDAPLPTPTYLSASLATFQCPAGQNPCATAEAMAQNATVRAKMEAARQRTVQTGREAGAWIYGGTNGVLTTGPLMDGAFGAPQCPPTYHCMPQMTVAPAGAVGMIHTHPQDPMPSGNDQLNARNNRVYSYVVSPTQIIALGPTGTILRRYTR